MFSYEKSIWGRGTANLSPLGPTAIRLGHALNALAKLPAGAKVLELGCGAGQFIRAIKKIKPNFVCYGADISEAAVAQAKQANDGVAYTVCGEQSLPYEPGFFDAVILFDVLEHVADPLAVLKQANTVLKPGGLLFAFVPCEGDATSLWRFLDTVNLKRDLTRQFAGHIQYFSRPELFELINSAGFKIKSKRYSEHFFGQLAGVLAFNMMARSARQAKLEQLNNEDYFSKPKSIWGKIISSLGNLIIYAESALLWFVPSPNVHVTAQKV